MEKAGGETEGGPVPRARGTGRGWGLGRELLSPRPRRYSFWAKDQPCLPGEAFESPPPPTSGASGPFQRVSEARRKRGGTGTGQPTLASPGWGGSPGLGALGWASGSGKLGAGQLPPCSGPPGLGREPAPLPRAGRGYPSVRPQLAGFGHHLLVAPCHCSLNPRE